MGRDTGNDRQNAYINGLDSSTAAVVLGNTEGNNTNYSSGGSTSNGKDVGSGNSNSKKVSTGQESYQWG